jgi:aspartyl protease family protein
MKYFLLLFLFVSILGCGNSEKKREINYLLDPNENPAKINSRNNKSDTKEDENVLYFEQENGVKYVWIEVNEIKLRFVFDTGASNICISIAEASVLYRQGTLTDEDFIGVENFQDASGRISEGGKVNLKKVKVGNNILENVEATVIENVDAPLLLGQSVLERFGNIVIDNENNRIVFKN